MRKKFNFTLFFLIVLLTGFGALFLSCLSASASLQRYGNTYYYLLHQLLFGLLPAIILGVIAYKISLQFIKKWAPLFVFLNLIALFFVFVPGIGAKAGGASRWIDLKFINFQPSEFLKITAILYLSAWIASKLSEGTSKDLKTATIRTYHNIVYILIPFLVFLGIIAIALFLQRDVSTMGIISLTLLALYFSAKTPLWHTLLIITGGISALLLMVKFEPYRLSRWLVFLHPDADPLGQGFQLKQSIISLGSGGIFGKG
ncbi:MAG: FtsW/RodA/SpoVE family cell cycle protein, partial [Candidatus Staskawiczbacteria bacterium]|nr:FtsW/RodA/SpoVE family cell cycle protein [Candidatus Staskawiczbacteria bacterium]